MWINGQIDTAIAEMGGSSIKSAITTAEDVPVFPGGDRIAAYNGEAPSDWDIFTGKAADAWNSLPPQMGPGEVKLGVAFGAFVVKSASNAEHTVYALKDPITGAIKYIGRTINPRAREAAHLASIDKGGLLFVPLKSGLLRSEARGLEQIYFEKFGGLDLLLNKINPISPFNPFRAGYLKAGEAAM